MGRLSPVAQNIHQKSLFFNHKFIAIFLASQFSLPEALKLLISFSGIKGGSPNDLTNI